MPKKPVELSLELRIYGIFQLKKISTFYEQHKDAWDKLFKVFVERHLNVLVEIGISGKQVKDYGLKMGIGQSIRRFPLQANGKLRWYGKDIHPYFDVVPVKAVTRDGNELQVEEKFIFNPQECKISDISMSVFSSRWIGEIFDEVDKEDQQEENDELLINSLYVLSCLIQYSPDVFGPGSHDSVLCLRALILPVILKRLVPYKSYYDKSDGYVPKVWIDMDISVMKSFLEEWLAVPVLYKGNRKEIEQEQLTCAGRSAGAVILGPQGVGKAMFCIAFLNLLNEVAPWMLVNPPSSKQIFNPVKFEKGGIVLDGAWLVSESSVYTSADDMASAPSIESDEAGRIGHRPLLHGESSPDKTAPQAIKRVQKVFSWIKSWASASTDKMLVIVIERMDVVIASRQARSVLSQLKWEMDNTCGSIDMFCLGTCRDYLVPALDRVDRNRNERYLSGFRVIKVFPCDLDLQFQGLLERVKKNSKLLLTGTRRHASLQEDVMQHPGIRGNMSQSGLLGQKIRVLIEEAERSPDFINKRTEWSSLLHNMNSGDINHLGLALQIYLSKRIHCPSSEFDQANFNRIDLVIDALNYTLNSPSLLNLLSPKYLKSRMFIRHDLAPKKDVAKIAAKIFKRTKRHYQYLHFIKLVPAYKNIDEDKSHYGNLKIYQSDVSSLVFHLHQLFRFRSSISIDAPEYCVPHHPKLSTNHPISATNPFDSFLWHNRQSCLMVNTLEQCVGFQMVPTRMFMTENKSVVKSSVGTHRSSDLKNDVGVKIGSFGAVKVGNMHTEIGTTGVMTQVQKSIKTAAKYNFPFSMGVDVGTGRNWNRERSTGTSFGQALDHGASLTPGIAFKAGRAVSNSYGKHETHGFEKGSGEHMVVNNSRSFEQPEALTRLVIGMRSLLDRPAKVAEKLGNIVLVFYTTEDCMEEVAIQRLGMPKSGKYSPPQRGCEHFRRHIRIQAPCCNNWFSCHICHDNGSDHIMDPKNVDTVECLNCLTRQCIAVPKNDSVSLTCTHCDDSLGTFSCGRCRLFRDDYTADAFVHCMICDCCYPSDFIHHHLTLSHSKKLKELE